MPGTALDNRFDVLAPDDIRLKGHRMGIETILFDYLDGLTPEEIVLRYPTLSLEEVHTAVAYYQRDRTQIDAYLRRVEEHEAAMRCQQEQNPSPPVRRLTKLWKARRIALAA